ncbi:MAG: hypothetical protein LBU94_00350, partial [Clostridiales bacterium]|nr:hypothetical protein [Clostridiales bacterium]
ARIIVRTLRDIGADAAYILSFLQKVYEPLGISVATDITLANIPRTYTAKQIAELCGVYSHNGHPHYQAVSCIINENLLIGDKHKTVITSDYGSHIGVSVRYDEHTLQAVVEWLSESEYPSEIYGFELTYYVLYDSEAGN